MNKSFLFERKSKFPTVKILLENKSSINRLNLSIKFKGKTKFVRVSEGFELSEFELSGVNYYKKHCQIQGELDLVLVSEEFELAGDYCIAVGVIYCYFKFTSSLSTRQRVINVFKAKATKLAVKTNGVCMNYV